MVDIKQLRRTVLHIGVLALSTIAFAMVIAILAIPSGAIVLLLVALAAAFPRTIGMPFLRAFDTVRVKAIKTFVKQSMGGSRK